MSKAAQYSLGLPHESGRVCIREQGNGQGEDRLAPVLAVALRDAAAPLGVEKLAGNIVRLLNGRTPDQALDLGAGARMFFHRNAAGAVILTRHDGQPGVSTPLAEITTATGQQHADPVRCQAALAALDNLLMAALCASADSARQPQPDGGGPRVNAPGPR